MSDLRDRQVKDLGEIITGRTPSTKRKDFYGGDYNLISPADLDNGKYIRTTHKRLTKLGFEQCFPLPRDTVLVGHNLPTLSFLAPTGYTGSITR